MAALSDIMIFGLQLYCRGVAGSHYKPRTTTIPPRHWGNALGRNSEHSPRTIVVGVVIVVGVRVEIVRGSSSHSSTWVLWYGANRSLLQPDVH